jgi:hypothetical protein
MITFALIVLASIIALVVGLCAGAGMTLAVHQREFAVYKADMDEMLEARDDATAQLLQAVMTAHAGLEAVIVQNNELSEMNAKILAALCKSGAGDAFSISTSNLKH